MPSPPLVRARLWVDEGPGRLPEQRPGVLVRPPASTAVCFSGGGTRSMVATIGQLRGLAALGLLARTGYLSCVSGSAWAAVPYLFAADGPRRLGAVTPPGALRVGALERIDPDSLLAPATGGFRETLEGLDADPAVPPTEVWIRAVGATFLESYGLNDRDRAVGCAAGAVMGGEADTGDRHRPRDPQPFPVVHATLNWPESRGPDQQRVPFEMTPLYAGVGRRRRLRAGQRRRRTVGGILLEPAAAGCLAPETPPAADGRVTVRPPRRPLSLALALGASSALNRPDRDVRAYPHLRTWTLPGPDGGPDVEDDLLTDGGDLDPLALLGMLRRKVTRIVVFLNSVWPLASGHDPARWPEPGEIDPALPPLFGEDSPRWPHNRVFPREGYRTLVTGLQDARREGRPRAVTTRLPVLGNDWWGIDGGWEVSVCWVYGSRVDQWETRLPEATRTLLFTPDDSGPAARFPHYLTVGQNAGALTRLTPLQANLLAELAGWVVLESAAELTAALGDPSSPW